MMAAFPKKKQAGRRFISVFSVRSFEEAAKVLFVGFGRPESVRGMDSGSFLRSIFEKTVRHGGIQADFCG